MDCTEYGMVRAAMTESEVNNDTPVRPRLMKDLKYGKGVVIAQQNNKVTVKFETCEKGFIINKKYPVRPTFENDTEIVEAFTEYDSLLEKIKVLKHKIALI